MPKQPVEAGVTTGFIWKRILLAVISGAAQRISGRTVDSDSHKICKRLPGIGADFCGFRRARAENRRNIDSNILQDCIRGCDASHIASSSRERNPESSTVTSLDRMQVEP